MEKLWLSNIAPGTSDEELTAFVGKYAPDLVCFKVERIEGEGSHPGALLSFTYKDVDQLTGPAASANKDAVIALLGRLEDLSRRLNGMYWKGRELRSSTSVLGTTR